MPVTNIAAYKFTPLADLKQRRRRLKQLCRRLSLRGLGKGWQLGCRQGGGRYGRGGESDGGGHGGHP